MFAEDRGVPETSSGVTRRGFLRAGGLGALGWSMAEGRAFAAPSGGRDRAVILLMLVGGPSQLETFDPKPDAPEDVRGPFGAIQTAVPGVRISEHLPLLARRMDRLTLIRSLSHDAAPIHETGHQLVQTGRLCRQGEEHPHVGSVVARLRGSRGGLPPFVVLPGPIGNTGVGVTHAQSAGRLGADFEPFHLGADPASAEYNARAIRGRAASFVGEHAGRNAFDLAAERDEVRDAFGRNTFGQSCLLASRLVESGVRLVTVNMYQTVFNKVSWDCHGSRPFSTFGDYSREVLPTFDLALSALLDDLDRRGLLDSTLVVATGEFGRTPKVNASGGRDHWPGVWSAVLAGGGTTGGTVLGASDRLGGEPADRPVAPAELVATMYRGLGIDPGLRIPGADGEPLALVEGARPIAEAFA